MVIEKTRPSFFGPDGTVRLRDGKTGSEIETFKLPGHLVEDIAISHDESLLATFPNVGPSTTNNRNNNSLYMIMVVHTAPSPGVVHRFFHNCRGRHQDLLYRPWFRCNNRGEK